MPTISISDATVVEGNDGITNLVFTLTLSTISSDSVTVAVKTTATSTATSDIDFTAANAIVTFAAGQTSSTFTVQVLGDLLFEPTEVLYSTLSNPSGGVIADATAIGHIVDNDSPYTNLPTDSFLKYQWHLYDNTGANVFPVWSSYTGRGVRVAVFDWGVDPANTDLSSNFLSGLSRNASNLSVGGIPLRTSDNHGTAVAGVISAAANNYETVGVAYDAKIVSILSTGKTTEISNAFTYAQNFDIINNSWGYGGSFASGTNWAFYDNFSKPSFIPAAAALKSLADNGRGGLGTIVVQSAGNAYNFGDDTNLHNFQNSRYIITVGATDYAGKSASYSSPGASILVSAPGGDGSDSYKKILTTDRVGAAGYSANDYTFLSGTSFSSPIVAGIVALMLEANPKLGYRDIQEILAYTARKTDTQNNTWAYNGALDWNGGGLHFDSLTHDLGYGLVDALAAVRLAETWNPIAKTSANTLELTYSSAPSKRIPDYTSSGGNGAVFDTINVTGNMRIERVEITLNITHKWIGDLSVLLSSPTSKSSSFLLSRPGSGALSAYGSSQDNIQFTLSSVLSWGELSAGNWQLGVFDSAAGLVGSLDNWTIKFIGSQVSNDNTYYYTNEFSEAALDQSARNFLSDSSGIDTINASAVKGNLTLNLGPSAVSTIDEHTLTLAAGTIIENAYGGDGNDSIKGNNSANLLLGMRGNDTIEGMDGDDYLQGGASNDTLDGGSGIDKVIYSGIRSNYTLTVGESTYTVTDKTGSDGTDTLTNIERLIFSDSKEALGITAFNESEVQKLYIAYFNRPGDPGGLGYWEGLLANGASMTMLQNSFSSSAEYQAIYIGQQNTVLITKLYQNLFGRVVDINDGGVQWWAGEMAAGRHTITTIAGALSSGTTPGSADNIAITNKIAAATAFTNALNTNAETENYVGTAAFAIASNWLAPIRDANILATSLASRDTTIASAVAAKTVLVNATGTANASQGVVTFVLAAASFDYTISGFGVGDRIDFATGAAPTLTNASNSDGQVNLMWSAGGNNVLIKLVGLSGTQDSQLNTLADFNTVFGVGSVY